MTADDAKHRRTPPARTLARGAALLAALAVGGVAAAGETWKIGEGTVRDRSFAAAVVGVKL